MSLDKIAHQTKTKFHFRVFSLDKHRLYISTMKVKGSDDARLYFVKMTNDSFVVAGVLSLAVLVGFRMICVWCLLLIVW